LAFTSERYSPDNRDSNTIPGILSIGAIDFLQESLFNDRFQYLCADRIQPQEDYPRFKGNESLGKRGEFTAHFLHRYGSRDIPMRQLSLRNNPNSYTLVAQVNDWLAEISTGVEIQTTENLSTNRIQLSYRFRLESGIPTQDQKPQNVGFGLTNTLPIVTAILSARAKDLLIIENPETHLHPAAQSKLASLFAIAGANGIQMLLETHSDHIINGIRVSIKKGLIDADNVAISYLTKTDGVSTITPIKADSEGGLEAWPKGFFDEWDNSLNQLI
jgi:predicted ATPase